MSDPLTHPRYPRSSRYDRTWVLERQMGPNALWLTEWLAGEMDLRPGQRVLDLGCGMAMSSVFLAREFGVQVWANDLWIDASDNWRRIRAEGLEDRVFPLRAEVHALPYADEFFDRIVSIDAYHYFGLEEDVAELVARLLNPGGKVGIVVPGRTVEIPDEPIPEHLRPWLATEPGAFALFQSAESWRRHLAKCSLLEVERSDTLSDGWRDWVAFGELVLQAGETRTENDAEEIDAIRTDAGRTLGFVRTIARRVAGAAGGTRAPTPPR